MPLLAFGRISDLKGGRSNFPPLSNMESMKVLDLIDFMYLTGNQLAGQIPGWILSRNKNVDISYNNFTWESSSPVECPRGSVNLVETYSAASTNKLSRVHPCLKKNYPCSAMGNQYYSLHINCGGKEAIFNNSKYEADLEVRGASMFYSGQNWAFSITGNFMDNDLEADVYIDANTSTLHNDTQNLVVERREEQPVNSVSMNAFECLYLNPRVKR
ncbi:unnamed protein product [Camellia sinensis]